MNYLSVGFFIALALLLPGAAAAYGVRPDIVEFDAVASFANGEQKVVLSWTAEDADGCQIRKSYRTASMNGSSMIATVEAEGVYVLTQSKTTTYELYCSKLLEDGFSFDSKEIKVSSKKPQPQPTCQLSAKPYLLLPGERSKITWKTWNAKEVRWQQDTAANVLGLPSKKLKKSGSERVMFAGKGDQTITLNLKGKGGSSAWCTTTLKPLIWSDF